ncbi:hypothetical protein [Pseudonocardia hydrocarbonoxydans]|uniref:Uncharacterized protein n=1 Tax=Pseudonocardia hydrocarbonoxydans TaxID=76726 RepID=A0A4Y3WPW6_9PSEU|nr:hypothetical protein [Pseudonocardia hydrocarbonoxydans]GEC20814.1 hypothetical protein PHY01_30970 [Pseudonocardia hydrocarbonoxydans]
MTETETAQPLVEDQALVDVDEQPPADSPLKYRPAAELLAEQQRRRLGGHDA